MELNRPPQRTGITNELAKERNRAAAERTMTAWIANCFTLFGFGIAVDQISQSLHTLSFPNDPVLRNGLSQLIALAFIVFAIALLIFALIQYRLEVKTIEDDDYVLLSIHTLNRFVVGTVFVFGTLSGLAILLLAE